MSAKIVVGLDDSGSKCRVLPYAKKLASLIGQCELIVVHVVEWSPFSLQAAQDNEERHKRREDEIASALEQIVTPVVQKLITEGVAARGLVRRGQVSEVLDQIAVEEGADQIIVARSTKEGLTERVFGSSAEKLVSTASVPVTVVG